MIAHQLDQNFFSQNRGRFYKQLPQDSIAIFRAASPIIQSRDQFHRYRQASNFFYLTGLQEPDCVLMMFPENNRGETELLFIPEPNNEREVWDGPMLNKEQAAERSGIERVQWLKDFEGAFLREQYHCENLYLDYEDMGFKYPSHHNQDFVEKVQKKLPGLRIQKAGLIMDDLRRIKTEEEIQLIQKSIEITHQGLMDLWAHTSPGVWEYELEAFLVYQFVRNNARQYAFDPIIASGIHTATLHYIENQKRLEDGDLLLTDVGANYSGYNADITRTVPVDGTFTNRQRDVYAAVSEVQEEIIQSIKPGIYLKDLNAKAKEMIGEYLIDLGLIDNTEDTTKYYMHSVSHFLGIETHDVGDQKKPLEPGCVITVEPGIYVQEECLGIRIEDDVLVTKDGCKVLSENIPKSIDAIETIIGS